MKIENQILATSGIDRKGGRIPEDGIVAMYAQTLIPQFLRREHDTIAPPIGRLLSKSLCVAVYQHAVVDGKLDLECYKRPIVVCRSGEIQDGKKITEEEVLDTYRRLDLPPLPDPSTASLEKPWVESKILAIAGNIEIFDEESVRKMGGMAGMSPGFTQPMKLRAFCFPSSAGEVDKNGRRSFQVVVPYEPHMFVNANPELFDIKQIAQVLEFSRLDFVIGVQPLCQNALKGFPWIIAFVFVSSQYFSGFLGELGRKHADGLSDWLEQLIASHKPKADEEIRFQFVMPLEIDDPSFSLKIAVGSGKISEFSRAYDEQKIIGEIERQSSHKVADIKEVSVSYLGGDTYRLEYAITRSDELIKPLE